MKLKQIAGLIIFCCFFTTKLTADIPEGYYDAIDGKKGAALKTELSKILVKHTRLSYNDHWYYYRTTDVKSDGRTVWDMYSNTDRYFPSKAGGSVSGMNREHSFPKSWWAEANYVDNYDAYSDLHHLYPADADANEKKSNYILGTNNGSMFNNGVTKVGKNDYPGGYTASSFEPDNQYKGDFARAYFYIVTCYEDYASQWRSEGLNMLDKNTYPVWKTWAKNMLLEWHRNDKVSSKETNRNEEVFKYQGNRNPFIDFPQLAEYIWGDSVGYEFHLPDVYKPKEPTLVTPDNLTDIYFGQVKPSEKSTRIVNVKGVDLNGNLSIILYGGDKALFSLSAKSITAYQANSESGYSLTISYQPLEYGEHHSQLIVQDGGMSGSTTVYLNGVCSDEETGIVPVGALSPDIYAHGKVIEFRTYEPGRLYSIYTVQGQLLASGKGTGNWETYIAPVPGIYIMQINGKTVKLVVNSK